MNGDRTSSLTTIAHSVFIVATNAVPLIGVLFFGWSIGTTLALFWAETLVTGTANVARIYAHRRATRRLGHQRKLQRHSTKKLEETAVEEGSYLLSYVTVLFPFSIGHGVFLFAILAMLSQHRPGAASTWGVDFDALRSAVVAIAVLATMELLVDLLSLSDKPFSWLRKRIERSIGNIVIFHLALLGGAVLLMQFETPLTFLPVIVVLKTAFDLGTSIPKTTHPSTPPGWFRYLGEKMNKDVDAEWADTLATERKRAEDDERRNERT